MNQNIFSNLGVSLFLVLALAACGSSGGGNSGNAQGGDDLRLGITSLNTKTVVASAPKSKIETMLALLGGKEAIAAISTNCADPAKEFDLSGAGASVCLDTALLVYEEIELENEGSGIEDEFEIGPFLVDMIGTPNDGISGTITLKVPKGRFNKLELEVGDLDDRNGDNSLDDSSSSGDDFPSGIDATALNNAGMANKSLKITGTAHDGLGGPTQDFVFFSNIEGKLEMPISLVNGEQLVVDGSTLVTFVDLSSGFSNLAFADITPEMNGSFGNDTERCGTTPTTFQRLACDIVQNVELYHDRNDDNSLDDSERRSGRGFDDSGVRD